MSIPAGKLIAIGGAEDKGTVVENGEVRRTNLNFFELGILRRIVEEAGGPLSRIEVVTTASMIPFEVGNNYLDAFGKIGCTNIGEMHIRNRNDATRATGAPSVSAMSTLTSSGPWRCNRTRNTDAPVAMAATDLKVHFPIQRGVLKRTVGYDESGIDAYEAGLAVKATQTARR